MATSVPALCVSTQVRDDWMVVMVVGDLDYANWPGLAERLETAINEQESPRVAVALSAVGFCDCSGLQCLVMAEAQARRRDGRCFFSGLLLFARSSTSPAWLAHCQPSPPCPDRASSECSYGGSSCPSHPAIGGHWPGSKPGSADRTRSSLACSQCSLMSAVTRAARLWSIFTLAAARQPRYRRDVDRVRYLPAWGLRTYSRKCRPSRGRLSRPQVITGSAGWIPEAGMNGGESPGERPDRIRRNRNWPDETMASAFVTRNLLWRFVGDLGRRGLSDLRISSLQQAEPVAGPAARWW